MTVESSFVNESFVYKKMKEKGWSILYEDKNIIRFIGKSLEGRSCTVCYDKENKVYVGFNSPSQSLLPISILNSSKYPEPPKTPSPILDWPSISFGD